MKMSKPILFSSFILAALLTVQTDVFARMEGHHEHRGDKDFTADKEPGKDFDAAKSPGKDFDAAKSPGKEFDAGKSRGPEEEFTAGEGFATE